MSLLTVRMISFCVLAAKRFHHSRSVHHQFVSLLMYKPGIRKRRPRSTKPMHVLVMCSRRIRSVEPAKHDNQTTQCTNSAADVEMKVKLITKFVKISGNSLLCLFTKHFFTLFTQQRTGSKLQKMVVYKSRENKN